MHGKCYKQKLEALVYTRDCKTGRWRHATATMPHSKRSDSSWWILRCAGNNWSTEGWSICRCANQEAALLLEGGSWRSKVTYMSSWGMQLSPSSQPFQVLKKTKGNNKPVAVSCYLYWTGFAHSTRLLLYFHTFYLAFTVTHTVYPYAVTGLSCTACPSFRPKWCTSQENWADICTKSLAFIAFNCIVSQTMVN